MGSHNGTYVPWHEPVWGHGKTKKATSVLTADRKARVPEECAPAVIGRALHALSCWALRDGDTGATGRLTDAELAQVAWPEGVAAGRLKPAALGALLRQALRAGGYLVGEAEAEAIHDFRDHNRTVLADRERRRRERAIRGASADSPALVHGQSMDSPRLARASGIRHTADGIPASDGADARRTDGALPPAPQAGRPRAAEGGGGPGGDWPRPCATCRSVGYDPPQPAHGRDGAGNAACRTHGGPRAPHAQAPATPAPAAQEAPERGYRVNPAVQSCAPRRPTWRTVRKPGRIPFDPEE